MKLMEKLNRKTLLEKVMKTRPPATSLWQKRESILLFTGTGATVLLASHMSVEDILFTIRDLADVQQVLVDQLRGIHHAREKRRQGAGLRHGGGRG